MRKLWFDLRESIGQAEETLAQGQVRHTSEPFEPWLVLDVNHARLWFTPIDAPRPRSATVAATHRDGPPPADGPWPLFRQPLTEGDTNGESVLDRLHDAARQGHRWLVAEASMPLRLYTAAVYDTDTVPETAIWTPAWLAAGELGPYPGEVAHGYQHHGSVLARFTWETVERIAADAQAHAARCPEQAANLLVLRDYGSGPEVFLVRAAGMPSGDLARLGKPPTVGMRHITADSDGRYRLTDDRWSWRHATPPAAASYNRQEGRHVPGPEAFELEASEPDIFESDRPCGSRCTVCGASGYDIAYEEFPSMVGYGTDITIWCRICRSTESYAEEICWTYRHAVWPPVLHPAPSDPRHT